MTTKDILAIYKKSILPWVALIKVYFESLKNNYFKKSFRIINKMRFYKVVPYMEANALEIEVGLQLIKFVIPLTVTYIRHSQGNCWKLSRRLLKQIQEFCRLLQQKDYQGTAKVNDVFKLLHRQKDCRWL